MTHDPGKLLLEVTALAREAGRAILEVYASSFSVQVKEDRSPLTEADLRSERLILAGLKRIAPEIPVLSEESGQVPFAARRNWSRLWVVDPLDGTKEFVQRNGEFTVNIALVDDHRPVLGIVHAPVLERDYYACEGVGAFRSDAQSAGGGSNGGNTGNTGNAGNGGQASADPVDVAGTLVDAAIVPAATMGDLLARGSLPFTGGDTLATGIAGLGLAAIGGGMLRLRRTGYTL